MVAMNPQTWDQDVAAIEPGGYLFYDSTKPMPPSKFRDDINVVGVPLTEICNSAYTDPRQRQLFKNIIYVGALAALLDIDLDGDRDADRRAVQGQGQADRAQHRGAAHGPRLRAGAPRRRSACKVRAPTRSATASSSTATAPPALGAVYGGATVCAWYPITPSTSLAEAFTALLPAATAPIPRPARRATPSSRPRTRSPRSASSSAPAGTARAPSPAPPGPASR